ncbi:MAG: hypothetical protein OEZ22_02235 [Spirochaetia bacterium]|nr:hypothetical protein [Spirochaetia bacterium]
MKIKSWTPSYVLNRLRLFIEQKRFPEEPWLTKKAIQFLDNFLKKSDKGLEFGMGRSTLWFSKRVASLVSYETDKNWFEKTNKLLKEKNIKNVKTVCVEENELNKNLKIKNIKNNSLDFILVDNKGDRLSPVIISIPLLKKGGILIIDNINWYMPSKDTGTIDSVKNTMKEWTKVEKTLSVWRRFYTSNGVFDTAIYIKPN